MDRRGLTLVEVLSSMLILAISGTLFIELLNGKSRSVERQIATAQGLSLAEKIMAFTQARIGEPAAAGFYLAGLQIRPSNYRDGRPYELREPYDSPETMIRNMKFPPPQEGFRYVVRLSLPHREDHATGEVLLQTPPDRELARSISQALLRLEVTVSWQKAAGSGNLTLTTLVTETHGPD